MKSFIRLALCTFSIVVTVLAIQSQSERALALDCTCSGSVAAYQYPDTFLGSNSYYHGPFYSPDSTYCAGVCDSWMWSNAGDMCNAYGLHGGVGFVIKDWNWAYDHGFVSGGTRGNGQQYDCDAFAP